MGRRSQWFLENGRNTRKKQNTILCTTTAGCQKQRNTKSGKTTKKTSQRYGSNFRAEKFKLFFERIVPNVSPLYASCLAWDTCCAATYVIVGPGVTSLDNPMKYFTSSHRYAGHAEDRQILNQLTILMDHRDHRDLRLQRRDQDRGTAQDGVHDRRARDSERTEIIGCHTKNQVWRIWRGDHKDRAASDHSHRDQKDDRDSVRLLQRFPVLGAEECRVHCGRVHVAKHEEYEGGWTQQRDGQKHDRDCAWPFQLLPVHNEDGGRFHRGLRHVATFHDLRRCWADWRVGKRDGAGQAMCPLVWTVDLFLLMWETLTRIREFIFFVFSNVCDCPLVVLQELIAQPARWAGPEPINRFFLSRSRPLHSRP